MTNEEHIEQLKKLRSFHNGSYGRSINKAIEALNEEKNLEYYRNQGKSYEKTINKLTKAISDNKSDDGLLIIKSVGFLTFEDLDFVRNEIIEQRKTGVVVLRQGWDAVLVPSDVEIKFEEREGKS